MLAFICAYQLDVPCLGISDTDKTLYKSISVHHLKHGNTKLSILLCLTGLAWPVLVANLLCTLHQENNNNTVTIPMKTTFIPNITTPLCPCRRHIPGNVFFLGDSFDYGSFDSGCIQICLVLGQVSVDSMYFIAVIYQGSFLTH